MIWTVHFAYDNVGWPSFERAAQMINDTGKFTAFKGAALRWHVLESNIQVAVNFIPPLPEAA